MENENQEPIFKKVKQTKDTIEELKKDFDTIKISLSKNAGLDKKRLITGKESLCEDDEVIDGFLGPMDAKMINGEVYVVTYDQQGEHYYKCDEFREALEKQLANVEVKI